jgi:hypothetical protein
MTLATHEEIVDAELIATDDEKRSAIDGLAEYVEGVWTRVIHLIDIRAWELPEYTDFDDMWEKRIAPLGLSIGRAKERPEIASKMRLLGLQQREIAEKLGAGLGTINRDLESHVPNGTSGTITNSRGQERPVRNARKEKEMPATLAHETPYKPGHVLTMDSRATKPLITVGEDGRATSTRESYIKAMDWWRENPRAQQYEAVKATGLPTSAMSETSSALRKNGEIPKVSNSGRAPIEEFGLLATAVKNLGLSVEKMLSEGTFEFIDSEGMDYYMDGLRDGMKSLRKFQQLAQQISNN